MKTRVKIKNLGLAVMVLFMAFFSVSAYSQACPGNNVRVTLQNITNIPAANTVEFDVYVENIGTTTMKLASLSGAVLHNAGFSSAGTFSVVTQPTAAAFPTLNNIAAAAYTAATLQMRWTQNPVLLPNAVNLPANTPLKFARFRYVSTAMIPYDFQLCLSLQEYVAPGFTAVSPVVYCNANTNSTALANGTAPINNGFLTIGGPYCQTVHPSTCFTAGTYTATPVTCFGNTNGTATITMSPVPDPTLTVTYVLDTNAPVAATLNASGAFTINGLTAGNHTVTVTSTSAVCPTPVTVPITIGGPTTPATNTTTITNCDTYTWAVTGTAYTASGTYTGTSTNGSGCTVNETLNLTINNSTTGTTTATACDTYTWAGPLGNGNTYTTSQNITNTTTNAAGCPHVETLNLTINNSTTGTTTATACDTYTWAGPLGNGNTYTTSQNVTNTTTNAAGCPHVQTLNLTINNSTTGTTTTTACDTYTWAAPLGNGNTYTTNQTLTNTSTNAAGCPHVQTLNLTINNSTSGTTTATACDTYTWAGPLGNGNTYTTSQNITNTTTNAAGCPHVQTLNLTINNSTTGTTTATACDTYTWAGPLGNGNTYTTSQNITNTTTNAAGCPHVQTLNLTINNSTTGTTTTTACDTYTWAAPLGNGNTYTTNQTLTNTSTNAAGCPHVQTLNLTINNSTSGTTTATACGSYVWAGPLGNGNTYTTSQTATNVTTNAAGCPHTQTLNLTVNSASSSTITTSACNSYTWALPLGNGVTYTTSQTGLTNTTTNAAGCTHTETLNLTINTPTLGTTNATACDSYTWAGPLGNGNTYTTSQTGVTFVSTNAGGCPHTQTLNLTINNSTTGTTTATACDSYTWAGPLGNGVMYTASVSGATYVTTNAAGCPHTQTLNLTINNSTTGVTNASACTSYTWAGPLGDGNTYTTSQAGLTNVTTNASGCPHTQTLNLTINTPTTGTTTATACNTYTWAGPLGNGVTYTTSQTGVTFVSTNPNGCQHTQTLNLTINNSTTGTTTTTACNSYTWALPVGNGVTYTSSVSGVVHNSINAAGCPHTQTLNLTINNSTTGTTNATACDSYVWAGPLGDGLTYTSSVTGLTHVTTNGAGCTHTQTLNLTINYSTTGISNETACNTYTWAAPLGNGNTYTTNQTGLTHVSTNAAGCSHTQTLNLTINNNSTGTTTTTACDSYTWAGPLGNGQTYTSSVSGVTHVSTNAYGCQHTQTLNLTINNGTTGTTTATACDSYTWALPLGNGLTYTSSVFGVTKVTTNANGCPHIQTLNLTINNSTSGTTTAAACDSYTWALPLGTGNTYTTTQTGLTNVTTNAAGCPHTQTLNLTINNTTSGTTNVVACNSYTWAAPLGNGQTYTASVSGVTNVTTNAGGCPHTQTLNLTINNDSTFGSVTTTAINTYTWAANGVTYTTSGTYTYVTTNSGGCTNTATLNLTIIVQTGTTWYLDGDGDGYGDPANTVIAPVAPPGYVAVGTDCNDTDATINPGAIEVCYDGIDNDCNGVIDNVGQPGGCIAIVTSLMPANCGATLNTLRDKLTAHYVVGAQGYRFRIKNLTDNTVIIRDRPVNFILLSSLPGVTFATTYEIDIALLINNVWQPYYGSICNVTTPTPTSTIGAHCGTTLSSLNQWVYATYNSSTTGYRFRITNTVSSSVEILDQVLNRFNFTQVPGSALNTTYFVEVALRNTDGTYLPYGPGCNITTGSSRNDTDFAGEFKVIAYPNPYAEDFRLNIRTSSDSNIQIRVYDMLGKQIENKDVEFSEIENLHIGSNYPSGVYNLIVTQQNTTQTVRVIKR